METPDLLLNYLIKKNVSEVNSSPLEVYFEIIFIIYTVAHVFNATYLLILDIYERKIII